MNAYKKKGSKEMWKETLKKSQEKLRSKAGITLEKDIVRMHSRR